MANRKNIERLITHLRGLHFDEFDQTSISKRVISHAANLATAIPGVDRFKRAASWLGIEEAVVLNIFHNRRPFGDAFFENGYRGSKGIANAIRLLESLIPDDFSELTDAQIQQKIKNLQDELEKREKSARLVRLREAFTGYTTEDLELLLADRRGA